MDKDEKNYKTLMVFHQNFIFQLLPKQNTGNDGNISLKFPISIVTKAKH